jgi:DNA topoisomerase-2
MSELTDDALSMMIKKVIDISVFNPNIKVYFNNTLIQIKNFKDYIKLFTTEENSDIIYEKINDNWEIGIIKSVYNEFVQSSIVNGTSTIQGGTHVNLITNLITTKLKTIISKGNKYNINVNDIKSKLFLFINCRIVNPEFSAQTKEYLTSKPTSFQKDVDVSDNFIKKITKSDITKEIIDLIEMKEQLALKKSLNNNPSRKKIKKLEDANKAGTKESSKCSLYLTEGDSALATVMRGFSVTGRDYYGAFPLRGKILNVRDCPPNKLADNEEIKSIVNL